MLATVWRCTRTMPMLEAPVRPAGRDVRPAVGGAGCDLRGWSERGIWYGFRLRGVGFGYNIHRPPDAQSLHVPSGAPMSSFSLLDPRDILLAVLGLFGLFYLVVILRATARGISAGEKARPSVGEVAIGYVTNFFDTLGIGSFATTCALFRLKLSPQQKKMWSIALALLGVAALVAYQLITGVSLFAQSVWYGLTLVLVVISLVTALWSKGSVDDGYLPGTLNVGHTFPTFAQAVIFTKAVPVDPMTLILLIVASVLGAWVGAGIVSKWSKRRVQMGMGIALLAAAGLLLMTLTGSNPAGGDLLKLTGAKLGIAFAD